MNRMQHTFAPIKWRILTIIIAVSAALLLHSCDDGDRFYGGRPVDGWPSQ